MGEWRIYVSAGPSVGLDASIGVSGSTIRNYDGNKKIEFGQLEGYGSSDNYGVFFMDYQHGGDNIKNTFGSHYGLSYEQNGGGFSIGSPVAFTRQFSYTLIFGR